MKTDDDVMRLFKCLDNPPKDYSEFVKDTREHSARNRWAIFANVSLGEDVDAMAALAPDHADAPKHEFRDTTARSVEPEMEVLSLDVTDKAGITKQLFKPDATTSDGWHSLLDRLECRPEQPTCVQKSDKPSSLGSLFQRLQHL